MKPDELPFTSLDAAAGDGTVFRCPLCAARFTHANQACPTCPINAGCALVTCPNCDYAFPRTSRLARWIERLARRIRGDAGAAVPPETS